MKPKAVKTSLRSNRVLASPIRKFLPLVRQAEARGIEVIKLNVGDPDIAPDPSFLRNVKNYQARTVPYAPSPGIIEHVAAWRAFYKQQGIRLEPNQIIPTVGCAEAMLISLLATCDPGDEVIVFEPLYSSYPGFAALANIKLVPITLSIGNGFALPSEREILKRLSKKTRALVVINPNNPTGTVLSAKEMNRLAAIAKQHRLFLIADETYREIVFNAKPKSFLALPGIQDNVIMLDSASKRFSLPGARLGVLVSRNQEIMDAVLRLAMIRLSVPTIEQYALIPLLKKPNPYVKNITREYKKRRDIVLNALQSMPGVITYAPQGALYLIAQLPIANTEDFILFMLKKFRYHNATVLIAPASGFYVTAGLGKNQIRIAYVVEANNLKRGLDILKRGLAAYKAKL